MKEFWSMVQMVFTGIGGWLGYFLGGCDGLIIALLLFVVMDYITGIMCAISDKKLSSEVGFKGICRKVLVFMLVGIANVLDVQVIGNGSILRTAVIFFYLSNEGISLLENAGHLGLPIPEKLKKVLEQLHDRSEEDKDGEQVWDIQIALWWRLRCLVRIIPDSAQRGLTEYHRTVLLDSAAQKAWGIGFKGRPPRPLPIMALIRMAGLACMWKKRIVPGVLPAMRMIREQLPLSVLPVRWNLMP